MNTRKTTKVKIPIKSVINYVLNSPLSNPYTEGAFNYQLYEMINNQLLFIKEIKLTNTFAYIILKEVEDEFENDFHLLDLEKNYFYEIVKMLAKEFIKYPKE